MDFPNDDHDHDKINNPIDQCVLIFRCYHCGEKFDTLENNIQPNICIYNMGINKNKIPNIIKEDICPKCKYKFTKCSVCSCPIKLSQKSNNECIVFCNKCSHGGHYDHYKGWFKEFNECPNSRCDCRCQQEDEK